MHRNRAIASACLAVASLAMAACSGGERATQPRPAAAARSTTQATEPPPRATAAETATPASPAGSPTDAPSTPVAEATTAIVAPPIVDAGVSPDAGRADPCGRGGNRRRGDRCGAPRGPVRDPWEEHPEMPL